MNVNHSIKRLTLVGVTTVALTVATVPAVTPSASASGSTLHVSGPISNLMHTNFYEKISGVAVSPANYVVAWEQFYKHTTGCATTFVVESTRAFFPGTWGLTPWLARPVSPGHSYSVTAAFGAQNLGTHGMCAYLINLSTGATYAHGQIWWTNHT